MIIEQYNIQLRRITINDIEKIRKWRNQPEIRKRMAYKKIISEKMQKEWFLSIDNEYNYYFMIVFEGREIGVINCKNVNLRDGYGEGGIFIGEPEYIGSIAPVMATLCLINAIFYVLKISNKSFVRILNDNPTAIQYNRAIGYSLIPGQENAKNQWYVLTKEDYEKKAQRLNNWAKKISKDDQLPRVYGEVAPNNLEAINLLLK